MIELSRALVRQFRAVVRKSVLAADPRGPCPLVVCRAGRQGLLLSCEQGKIAVRHLTHGSFPSAVVALPFSKLAELENAAPTIILEQTEPSKGQARWQGGEGLCVLDFDTSGPPILPPFSETARNAVSLQPGFLTALDEAAHTASRESVRYATNHILLRGKDGAVIATDGKQLLFQGGFRFPWPDSQFILALPVFGCRELPRDQPIKLGLIEERITLEVGPWLFAFKTEQVRFPDVDKVIPNVRMAVTRLHLDPEDVQLLGGALSRFPGQDDPHRPVTLDLGNILAVRAGDEKGSVEEVVLSRSKRDGPPLQTVMDRRYLLRALKMGFTEVLVVKPDQPLLCRDAKRTYVWMPLTDSKPLIAAPLELPKRISEMPPNEEPRNGSAISSEPFDPISEAEELARPVARRPRPNQPADRCTQEPAQTKLAVQAAVESLRRLGKP